MTDNATVPVEREAINAIAMACASNFGLTDMTELYRKTGSATAVVERCRDIRALLPDASERLVKAVATIGDMIGRATDEYGYAQEHGIKVVSFSDNRYPARMRQCPDAPLVLFMRGNADLNSRRIVSVVGTRHCTAYGQDLTNRFVRELQTLCPQTLVVSGLAYGIDICAHNEALNVGLPTVGVLAHGLDTIYPPRHKTVAERMVEQGGLVTEFACGTRMEKLNFVRRNRIVAGMADVTVLVESAAHGGGLITTRLAREYSRDVFAFPGAVGAPYSAGCNNLIRAQGARLLTSAADLVETMGWQEDKELAVARQQGIVRDLFPSLSPQEQAVANLLSKHGDMQADTIATHLSLAIPQLTPLLFALEMKGVVRLYAGGKYHFIS